MSGREKNLEAKEWERGWRDLVKGKIKRRVKV